MKMKKLQSGLSGAQIVGLIQKGHAVRRACWVKGYYIRVTNERGFDKKGNVLYDEDVALYTIATNGYFMHLAYSNQPFAVMHLPRSGEGIAMLFANDWEDYGFISADDFDALIESTKDKVRKEVSKFRRKDYD